jgi:hypothetical protein
MEATKLSVLSIVKKKNTTHDDYLKSINHSKRYIDNPKPEVPRVTLDGASSNYGNQSQFMNNNMNSTVNVSNPSSKKGRRRAADSNIALRVRHVLRPLAPPSYHHSLQLNKSKPSVRVGADNAPAPTPPSSVSPTSMASILSSVFSSEEEGSNEGDNMNCAVAPSPISVLSFSLSNPNPVTPSSPSSYHKNSNSNSDFDAESLSSSNPSSIYFLKNSTSSNNNNNNNNSTNNVSINTTTGNKSNVGSGSGSKKQQMKSNPFQKPSGIITHKSIATHSKSNLSKDNQNSLVLPSSSSTTSSSSFSSNLRHSAVVAARPFIKSDHLLIIYAKSSYTPKPQVVYDKDNLDEDVKEKEIPLISDSPYFLRKFNYPCFIFLLFFLLLIFFSCSYLFIYFFFLRE